MNFQKCISYAQFGINEFNRHDSFGRLSQMNTDCLLGSVMYCIISGIPLPLSKAMEGMELIQWQCNRMLWVIGSGRHQIIRNILQSEIPICTFRHVRSGTQILHHVPGSFGNPFSKKITLILVNSHLKKEIYF